MRLSHLRIWKFLTGLEERRCFFFIFMEKSSLFNLLKDYPCDAISWEDKLSGPSLQDARKLTDKCLIGGIDHFRAVECTSEEIIREARDSIDAVDGRGFILAPGCTFPGKTPEANMFALREAVRN